MTYRPILLLAALCLPLCACSSTPGPVYVTSHPEPRSITVIGDAEVKVAPDEAEVSLGVETFDPSLSVVRSKIDDSIRKLMEAATSAGVEPKHIQTEYIEIEPRYHDPYERKQITGYFARKTVRVIIKDLRRFEAILARVVESGGNLVMGVQFRTTELRKHRDTARQMAVQAAREKAEAMAGHLDQKITRPYLIEEENQGGSGYWGWWGSRYGGGQQMQNAVQNVGGPGSTEGSLAPGQISITARVKVRFELK